MERTCPACGTPAESAGARFCGRCGTRLAAPEGEVATVLERVAPAAAAGPSTAAPGPAGDDVIELTALCPSCGAANPPDSEVCEFCGEEIPVDQRRRRTAVLGALGAGGAGVAGGMLVDRGGVMEGMGQAGEGLSGLGQSGGMPGMAQPASDAMSGLGQSGAMPGMSGATPGPGVGMGSGAPSNLAPPPGPGAAPAPPPSSGVSPSSMGAAPSGPSAVPAQPGGGPLPADAPFTPATPPSPPGGLPATPPPPQTAPGAMGGFPGAGGVAEGGSRIGGIIIKTVLGGIGVIGGVAIGGVVLGGILVFTGDPEPCVDRVSTPSNAAVAALFERWNQFTAQAEAGPASVSFSEEEATSRAQQYLNEKDIPLENAQVYFCPDGRGQVKGRVNALGRNINVLLSGRVDTSQQPPVIVIDEIKAGNLPSAVAETIVGDRLDRNDVKVLDFGIPISAVNVADGQVTLESPGP